METKVKRVGADFRTGTIAYYGPDDKTVTKVGEIITHAHRKDTKILNPLYAFSYRNWYKMTEGLEARKMDVNGK